MLKEAVVDKDSTTRHRAAKASSPGAITRIFLPLPLGVALKDIERAFLDEGFELFQRVAISDFIQSRIGVEVDPVQMLLLIHPVLAFEALVTGNDACGLLPLIITLKASSNKSSIVEFRSSVQEMEDSDNPMSDFVTEQSQQLLSRALSRLAMATNLEVDQALNSLRPSTRAR